MNTTEEALGKLKINTIYFWIGDVDWINPEIDNLVHAGKVRENWFNDELDAILWIKEVKNHDEMFFDGASLFLKKLYIP